MGCIIPSVTNYSGHFDRTSVVDAQFQASVQSLVLNSVHQSLQEKESSNTFVSQYCCRLSSPSSRDSVKEQILKIKSFYRTKIK